MPFVAPTFQEKGEAEIIDNLLEVVHRDMKLALDYYWLVDALPDFAAMTLGEDTLFEYPLLVAGLERMSSVEDDSGEYVNQDLRVGVGIVVKDTTVAGAKRKAAKYVRAFKAVVRSASMADLFPASNLLLDHVVDIDHRYLRHGTNGTDVTQPVEFELKFKFGEK